jgi:hypothetical protein
VWWTGKAVTAICHNWVEYTNDPLAEREEEG